MQHRTLGQTGLRIAALVAPIENMMWFAGRPENNLPPTNPGRHVPQLPTTTHS